MSDYHSSRVNTPGTPGLLMTEQEPSHVARQGAQCDQVDGNGHPPSPAGCIPPFPPSLFPLPTQPYNGSQQPAVCPSVVRPVAPVMDDRGGGPATIWVYPEYRKASSPGGQHYSALGADQRRSLSAPYPPRSPQRLVTGTSRPIRSPKRTISFDFPHDMDPRRRQEIHRQIVQMAQEAGTSHSVKIVEEDPEEDELIPIIQLQDPPKPKFKRQLSADNSPPQHKPPPSSHPSSVSSSTTTTVPVSTVGGKDGARMDDSGSLTARLRRYDGSYNLPAALSPKRLKADHDGPSASCPTTPKSPVVRQLTRDVAQTSLSRRTGSWQADRSPSSRKPICGGKGEVVHIFPLPETAKQEGDNNNNNSSNKNNSNNNRTKTSEADTRKISTSSDWESDETDYSKKEESRGDPEIVSVFSTRKPRTANNAAKVVSPLQTPVAAQMRSSSPQDSIHTLQMLFKRKEDKAPSNNRQTTGTERTSDVNTQQRESHTVSKSLTPTTKISESLTPTRKSSESLTPTRTASESLTPSKKSSESLTPTKTVSESSSPTKKSSKSLTPSKTMHPVTSKEAFQNAEAEGHEDKDHFVPQKKSLMATRGVLGSLGSSDAAMSPSDTNKDGGQSAELDPYLAELTCHLEDMQRRIFSQQELSTTAMVCSPQLDQKGQKALENRAQHGLSACSGDVPQITVSSVSSQSQASEHKGDNTDNSDLQRASNSSSTLAPGPITSSVHVEEEEESRTARLCQSKVSPFTFTPKDIEKARGALSGSQSVLPNSGQKPAQPYKDQTASAEGEMTKPRDRFLLGELWATKARKDQEKSPHQHHHLLHPHNHPNHHHHHHRQLSDPGDARATRVLPRTTVVETVKSKTLRQFSEPTQLHHDHQTQTLSMVTGGRRQTSLLSTARFGGDCSSDTSDLTDGHAAGSITGDDVQGTGIVMGRNASPRTQSPMTAHQRSSSTEFDTGRKHQPDQDSFKADINYLRSEKEHPWGPNRQPYTRPAETYSGTPTRWLQPAAASLGVEEARKSHSLRPTTEDDSVFEDVVVSEDREGLPFRDHASPMGYGDCHHYLTRDRSSGSRFSTDSSGTPKQRPALRSQSNVEQSPNKAELEAMAQYKYLRSYSEHILDPQRLVAQLRALSPANYQHLIGQVQDMCRGASRVSCASEPAVDRTVIPDGDRRRGARRALFSGATDMGAQQYDNLDWQQGQGCNTYPPPLARRQSFSSARSLRRSVSWMQDRDSSGHSSIALGHRQPGDLDIRVECSQANAVPQTTASPPQHRPYLHHNGEYDSEGRVPVYHHHHQQQQHPGSDALRMKIETSIQQILANHLQHKPSFTCQADMDRWVAQAAEIERLTREASHLIGTLSEHRRCVYDVSNGSVIIKVNCSTLLGALDLWEKYESGALHRAVGEAFGGQQLTTLTGIGDVELGVSLCYLQYSQCLEELDANVQQASSPVCDTDHNELDMEMDQDSKLMPSSQTTEKRGAASFRKNVITSPRDVTPPPPTQPPPTTAPSPSPTTASKRTKFTYSDCSTRKAFSELNLSDGELTPTSPSGKKTFLFESFQKENPKLSPLASPRIQRSPSTRGQHIFSDVMNENFQFSS